MPQQVVQVVAKGRLLGTVEIRNMFYYGCNTSIVDTSVGDALAAQIQTLYGDLINDLWDGFEIYEIQTNVWDSEQLYWQPLTNSLYSGLVGAQDGDMSSFQTAILMGARTIIKAARGRKFLAGVAEMFTLDGQIAGDIIARMADVLVDYLSPVDITGRGMWYPGIVSKNSPFAPFLGGWFGNILSTMRRRKPGYGI